MCLSPVSSLINTPAECWSVAGHGDTETEGRQEADPSTEGREGACTAALHSAAVFLFVFEMLWWMEIEFCFLEE